ERGHRQAVPQRREREARGAPRPAPPGRGRRPARRTGATVDRTHPRVVVPARPADPASPDDPARCAMNRPQTSGPLDLDVLLRAVADEVTPRTDDETAARRVVGGVRHARRRRAVLVGTAAVLAVAAVGVGASAVLADDPRPVLPAPAPSPDPTPTPSPVARDGLLCQAPAPAATGPDLLATVSGAAPAVSVESLRLVDVAAHLTVADDARAEVLDPVARAGYVILQDGVVVSST